MSYGADRDCWPGSQLIHKVQACSQHLLCSDATKEFFLWANVFLKRGMATLAPDAPGQGETRNKMAVRHDYEGAGAAMLDFLEQRDDVDASAIGVTGVSMGDYYAPRVAAFEPRVRAVVSISGAFKTQMSPARVGEWIQFTHWAKTPEEAARIANQRTLEGVIGNIRFPIWWSMASWTLRQSIPTRRNWPGRQRPQAWM
jgi:dienelactone hydrolase